MSRARSDESIQMSMRSVYVVSQSHFVTQELYSFVLSQRNVISRIYMLINRRCLQRLFVYKRGALAFSSCHIVKLSSSDEDRSTDLQKLFEQTLYLRS